MDYPSNQDYIVDMDEYDRYNVAFDGRDVQRYLSQMSDLEN